MNQWIDWDTRCRRLDANLAQNLQLAWIFQHPISRHVSSQNRLSKIQIENVLLPLAPMQSGSLLLQNN